jgi:hypothetical protein
MKRARDKNKGKKFAEIGFAGAVQSYAGRYSGTLN